MQKSPTAANDTKNAVLELVASETKLDQASLDSDWTLSELGLTSFAIMRLIVSLEESFDIEFSEKDLTTFLECPAGRLHEIVQRAAAAES